MPEPILCHECPHFIEHHDWFGCQMCKCDPVTRWATRCRESSSSIARAYGEQRFHEGWDACELRWAVRCSE